MDLLQNIRNIAHQPLTHQLLTSFLKDYKRPNDKIHELISAGIIQSVKKGIYLPTKNLTNVRTEPFLLANHLLGPSYISFDTALSYYGLIPERVFEISSGTTKVARQFQTPVGSFSYTRLPLPYYSLGIQTLSIAEQQNVIIATPEKALFDKVAYSAGIILRSQTTAAEYLLDNLRMDEHQLKELNTDAMETWLEYSPKQTSLTMVLKLLRTL
jgi:predicted transcriptional regulator of viral defense system